jgi:hypothetical protein
MSVWNFVTQLREDCRPRVVENTFLMRAVESKSEDVKGR